MKKLRIYDPALCCSTGVCGPSPDQALVAFAGVLKTLEGEVAIERHNLAQEPGAFASNPQVREILEKDGADALPALFLDDTLVMKGVYPTEGQLRTLLGLTAARAGGDQDSDCCAGESDCGAGETPAKASEGCGGGSGCC